MSDELEEWTPSYRATQTAIHLENFYNATLRRRLDDIPLSIFLGLLVEHSNLDFVPAFIGILTLDKRGTGAKFRLQALALEELYRRLDPVLESMAASKKFLRNITAEEVVMLFAIFPSLFYCIKAKLEEKAGKHGLAWTYACDAEYLRGLLYGLWDTVGSLRYSSKAYLSRNGQKGAAKRNEKYNHIKEYASNLYEGGRYPSAHAAAYELADIVLEFAESVGARMSKPNAQRTIAEWLKAHEKNPSSGQTDTSSG